MICEEHPHTLWHFEDDVPAGNDSKVSHMQLGNFTVCKCE